MDSALIASENVSAILTILMSIVLIGVWMEQRPKLAMYGVVFIIAGGILLGNLSVLPQSSDLYPLVTNHFIALSIPLLLFKANLKQILSESGRMFVAFLVAASATTIGSLLVISFFPLGEDGGKWAAIISSALIGGAVNAGAVSGALGLLDDPMMSVQMGAVNVVVIPYLALIMVLPGIQWLWRLWSPKTELAGEKVNPAQDIQADTITGFSIVAALTASAVIVAIASALAELTGSQSIKYMALTLLPVCLATFKPEWTEKLTGHYDVGRILIYLFFATLGIRANVSMALSVGTSFMIFTALLLLVHVILVVLMGRLFRLSGPELLVASNACILGPPTAAAMAAARGWQSLILPGLLCGVFGFFIANIIGITLGNLTS